MPQRLCCSVCFTNSGSTCSQIAAGRCWPSFLQPPSSADPSANKLHRWDLTLRALFSGQPCLVANAAATTLQHTDARVSFASAERSWFAVRFWVLIRKSEASAVSPCVWTPHTFQVWQKQVWWPTLGSASTTRNWVGQHWVLHSYEQTYVIPAALWSPAPTEQTQERKSRRWKSWEGNHTTASWDGVIFDFLVIWTWAAWARFQKLLFP